MTGRVHSLNSLGTVDGPGVRFVVFMQGCPLRCAYCHNPDTWELTGGEELEAGEVFRRVLRCKSYFGEKGGVTVSGGEPLLQAGFVTELFDLCRQAGISTALDTSGCLLNDTVKELLSLTDLCLLDYKMTDAAAYEALVRGRLLLPISKGNSNGAENELLAGKNAGAGNAPQGDIEPSTVGMKARVDEFLEYLFEQNNPVWLRQVIVPEQNDTEENILALAELKRRYTNITHIELLPFRTLCVTKYKSLGLPFALADVREPEAAEMKRLEQLLEKVVSKP